MENLGIHQKYEEKTRLIKVETSPFITGHAEKGYEQN